MWTCPKPQMFTLVMEADVGGELLQLSKLACCDRTNLSSGMTPSFDVFFQRLSSEAAIILPSSPTTVTGLRTKAALQKCWSQAKRHAFRTWPYLINSPTGMFLVTKTIKTTRYAHCLSRGTPGQMSQIRVNGSITLPPGSSQFKLPTANNQWIPVRNDLEFELEDSGGKGNYTIFMERESSRIFLLSDSSLKDTASKLWR